jgi:DNA-binding MarR family transcriptional regulator
MVQSNDTRTVMDAVRCIVHSVRVASRTAEKELGLSGAQLFVLGKLADGKATSVNELAQRTLTHQSSVSVVVHKLVKGGLVASAPSAADGRRVELSLTRKGRSVIAKSPQAAQEQLIEALENMPCESRKRLAELLQDFVGRAGIAEEFPALLMEDGASKETA